MLNKFCWVIICIFLFPFRAEGADAEWVRIPEINHFYVDVDSIDQVGPNQYKACFKAELINDVFIMEIERYGFFDCAERKAKALKTFKYLRDGMIAETGEEDLENIPPDSIMADVLQFVCTYRKGILNIPLKKDN